VQDRGLAAYIAELVGTFFLVLVVGTVVTLYVSVGGAAAQFGSDFAVVGLVHALVLFLLVTAFGRVSGGHFNPAVTLGAWAMKKIDGVDGIVYMLAQLSGGVLGALLVKGLLLDEGRAGNYGATDVSPLLAGDFAGAVVEAIGTFLLVLAVIVTAMSLNRALRQWAPLVIGTTLGFAVMTLGPLTGGSFNPARWFGPALIGDSFGGTWPYLVGPAVGALLAVAVYRFVIAPSDTEEEKLEPAPGA
jgi:MIP family channel proteins